MNQKMTQRECWQLSTEWEHFVGGVVQVLPVGEQAQSKVLIHILHIFLCGESIFPANYAFILWALNKVCQMRSGRVGARAGSGSPGGIQIF